MDSNYYLLTSRNGHATFVLCNIRDTELLGKDCYVGQAADGSGLKVIQKSRIADVTPVWTPDNGRTWIERPVRTLRVSLLGSSPTVCYQ
jgi:hypothetical protein